MSGPQRIQLSRKRGWRLPAGAVRCCRPGPWGNPFQVLSVITNGVEVWKVTTAGPDPVTCENREKAQELAVNYFILLSECEPGFRDTARKHLAGKDLACWCKPGEPCHADVLLEIANAGGQP